jgi:DNA invertase Pin-like site-specific DNA recombinase
MTNVALYLRKSRDEENESRDVTLARHEKMLTDYCDRNDLIIKKIYKEVVSGESISARIEMQKLLIDVRAGLFDAVCVIELERLSRGNQADQAEILDVFKRTGTKIHTLTKVYDLASDNEIDEEFFEFGLFMSRREYKVICRRLLRGRMSALLEGYYTGSVLPFGFNKERRDKGFVLVPNEAEAEIVRVIFTKYLSGEGLTAIAHQLNACGLMQRNGKEWQPQRIREVLKNKTYVGMLHVKNAKIDETWTKGKHEPLIEPELFDKAQRKLSSAVPKAKRSLQIVNPLAGLIRCSECGSAIVMKKNGSGVKYLSCNTLDCKTHSAKFDDVESQLLLELSEALRGFQKYVEDNSSRIELKASERAILADRIDAEINKKESMLERCCELLEEGIYTKEKYLQRVKILEDDLAGLLETKNQISYSHDEEEMENIKTGIPILEKCLQKYEQLDVVAKNEILRSLIDKIEFDKPSRGKSFDLKIYMKI